MVVDVHGHLDVEHVAFGLRVELATLDLDTEVGRIMVGRNRAGSRGKQRDHVVRPFGMRGTRSKRPGSSLRGSLMPLAQGDARASARDPGRWSPAMPSSVSPRRST